MASASSTQIATHAQLRAIHRNMLLQRAVDNRGFQLNRQGKIAIAMSAQGHEAIHAALGLAFVRGRDTLYPYYRDSGALLACGFPLRDLFRSLFARAADRSNGRQIINHVTAHDLGIATISSIVAAQCTHAAGAAFALQLRAEGDRAIFCTFGDGATSEGEWHEALNFAAVRRLPLVFVCENNRYAISTPQSKQMAIANIAERAAGYGMPGVTVDGFDPLAVYGALRDARARAVAGDGPTLVEAQCYRFLAHTTDDDDRTYRSRKEVESYRASDAVPRFERLLIAEGVISEAEADALRRELHALVDATTDEVEREPEPEAAGLYGNVYAAGGDPWI
jgi:2-oxoisovalerate dehydrogenase E1 component alpha subunit